VLSKSRRTKLGDYRFDPKTEIHRISVNKDLNPYNFLITYVHEVAHCANVIKRGRKVPPHGSEWKEEFRHLMNPLLTPDVFPNELLRVLANHMRNPKASSQTDPKLVWHLRKHDHDQNHFPLLDVNDGTSFRLNNRVFTKVHLRRTRVLFKEYKTGRNYLVSATVPIEPLDG